MTAAFENKLSMNDTGAKSNSGYAWIAIPALILITAAGAFLRFKLGLSQPVTSDEMISLERALLNTGQAVFNRGNVVNPPVHIIIMSAILDMGGTVNALRMFFSCAGTLIIPASFFMARRYFGAAAAILLSLIVACNTMFIIRAPLMRGDALACLFTVISVYFLYDAIKSNRNHYVFLAFAALAVYSHYFTSVAFFFIAVYFYRERIKTPKFFPHIAALAFLPAAAMILWGSATAGGTTFALKNAPLLLREEEFFKRAAFVICDRNAFLLAAVIVCSAAAFQKERMIRFVWVSSAAACIFIALVYMIADYYLAPLFIFCWAQLCSAVVPPRFFSARNIAAAVFILFYINHTLPRWAVEQYRASGRIVGQQNTGEAAETAEQLKAIRSAGVNSVFVEYCGDFLLIYSAGIAPENISDFGKHRLLDDLVFSNEGVVNGYTDRRHSIYFRKFDVEDMKDIKAPAALLRNKTYFGAGPRFAADVSNCAPILKTASYESYLCGAARRP